MKILRTYIYVLLALILAASCEPEPVYDWYGPGYGEDDSKTDRIPVSEKRNVLLLYSVGFNSLSNYLEADIEDVKGGWLPSASRNADVMLVYSHLVAKDYATPNPPVLCRLYKTPDGKVVTDTLVVYDKDTRSASAEQLNDVLTYVNETFPAKSYGMVFSSHATGYLPAGYYSSPTDYTFDWDLSYRSGRRDSSPKPVPYVEPWRDPELPAVKSIGQDLVGPYGDRVSYEIELPEFAAAIPMHMRYILFDACLMGGVEVAYELKDKCDMVGFSPTEVLSEGFDYSTLTLHLLCEDPDPKAVCEAYYNQYRDKSGVNQSATISLVDCSSIDRLAGLCKELFTKYRKGLELIAPVRVQQYYTYSYHWFYDLESIIYESGKAERYYLENKKTDIESKIRKAEVNIMSYATTLQGIEEDLASLVPGAEGYEDSHAALMEQKEKYQKMLTQQESELEKLRKDFSETEKDLEEVLLGWDARIAELNRDMDALRDVLDECIIYKASTQKFLNMFTIWTYSGLSMYLPCDGGPNLDKYYKTLSWNMSTGLVK